MILERLGQQHLDHRRHERAGLDPVLLDQGDPAGRVEPPHQVGGARLPCVQAGDRDQQPVGVRQRERQQDRVAARAVVALRPGRAGGIERGVGQGDALGAPGGAAGVEQGCQVIRAAVDDRQLLGLLELLPGDAALAPDHHDGWRPGAAACTFARNSGVVMTATAPESWTTWRELLLGQQEQHGSRDGAGPPDRLVGQAHLRAVGHADHDPVARPDADLRPGHGQPGQLGRPARPRCTTGPRTAASGGRRSGRAALRRGARARRRQPRRTTAFAPVRTSSPPTVAVRATRTVPSSFLASTTPRTDSWAPSSSSSTTTGREKRTP